ncbi:DUF6992 family protein [Salibacter sp.]|uniref:DUF6992 family protein n=1 Tax=Salibacter sp. TaxID=2010995 RepID=UPI0028701932|nr:hypothetical protein [Salibacter sp.]MDR9398271.1 hypothetical protein [Salibacter sp.]MDR9487719.1 hypothetical protein [Salibacter sp.]
MSLYSGLYDMRKHFLTLLIFISISVFGYSQSQTELETFNQKRQHIVTTGMYVLGGWAVANMVTGGIGYGTSSGEARYFHQMNMMWNTVNLGLSASSLLFRDDLPTTLKGSLEAQQNIEHLLLFNAGLDVAYITAGFYLKERAKRGNRYDRFTGYGNSLLLQGGFLLLFDGVMYFTLRNHGSSIGKILEHVQFSSNSVGVSFWF